MKKRQSLRINPAAAGLIVVDLQERLLAAMFERERLIGNAIRMIKGSRILGLPVFVTEQYPKGLGRTNPDIVRELEGLQFMEKLAFSACGAPGFDAALKAKKIADVLLCGMETHVCVSQTCLDLLDQNYRVFVIADAVSSRTLENHRIGLERMREAGAVIVSAEMALFELLQQAGSEEFKQILTLVK